MKIKTNKWDLIKLKSICTAQKTIRKQKDNSKNGRKYLQTKEPTRDLAPKIYKQLVQLTKKTTQSKSGQKIQTFLQGRYTDGQKAHERCFTSLIIKEMQIKTTMRYHLTLVRTAIIKKPTDKCWRGYGGKETFLYCWWECKFVQPLWRTV